MHDFPALAWEWHKDGSWPAGEGLERHHEPAQERKDRKRKRLKSHQGENWQWEEGITGWFSCVKRPS